MEIPTYPYDKEKDSFARTIQRFIDRIYRYKFASYIDKIVTFSSQKYIFSRPTIRISNGVDFDNIKLKTNTNDTNKELNLIGVAQIHTWHGFDRLIKGLSNYYKTNPSYIVNFHLVGPFFSEIEKNEITHLVELNNLTNHVIIHGERNGKALDNIFDSCDMAIGSLGRHRSGITNIKTLKNREYAARGIPFVYSETDDDFENMSYILKVPHDNSDININELILFYNNLIINPTEIRASISHLSWNNQIKNIIDQIYTEGT